jgi:hypothetical protein
MLIDPIFKNSGLGNQLACYITTRCLALDKGYQFGVVYPERFKGTFFPNLELPEVKGFEFDIEGQPPTKMPDGYKYYRESMANDGDYDDAIFNIPDNHIIHGNLQGVKYFEKHREEINRWLEVEPLDLPDDLCIINFRGGEYYGVPAFFLPQSYWDNAIQNILKVNPNMKFEVHTDDPATARLFFGAYKIIKDIELNWRSIRYAKYLILSNSSFALLPAWLGDAKMIIAPLHFARHNEGYWFLKQNYIEKFNYLDKNGNLDSQQL